MTQKTECAIKGGITLEDLLVPILITIVIAIFCCVTHFPLQVLAFIMSLIALAKS